jgi:DNA primase
MSEIEEIKSKLDIVEVIREYIPVRAAGASFQARCPFHNEKTPSFSISPDKQMWYCFGCSRGGDVFSFVMEKDNLSFVETLRLLAKKAGVVLRGQDSQDYSKRNRLLDIMELAAKYYEHIFWTETGASFRAYLMSRGLSEETIRNWHLGCSQDAWDGLYKFLKSRPKEGKKFSDEEIFLSGLTVKRGTETKGGGYYDRFRDRIMFPISDVSGSPIAFTARVNPDKEKTEKMGKYINSPQTQIYDKSRVLFGLDQAKAAIRTEDLAIVVEGQMDVISCHQHGFKNVVASSGTALTAEQIALIKRFTQNIALLFDMDQAGQMAADRGIKEALAQEMNLKVIVLATSKDPADALNKDPEEFRLALMQAKPMMEYYFEKVSAGLDLGNMDNKRLVSDKIFAMVHLVANKAEQGYWLKQLSELLGFFEPDIREQFVKWQAKNQAVVGDKPSVSTPALETPPVMSREEKLGERLAAILLRFPEFVSYAISSFEPEELLNKEQSGFYRNLIIYYNKAATLDYTDFRIYLADDANQQKLLDKLALLGERDFYDFSQELAKKELINIISDLKLSHKQQEIRRIQQAISQAEKNGRSDELATLMEDLKNLTAG